MATKEVGRYRKLYPRIWRDPGFRGLKPAARELALYILTGPQTNAIGLFTFSLGQAAEDLRVGHETIVERLADVRQTFGWHFDPDARVMFIPSWWTWNRPENPNVLRGNMKLLSEIPPTGLMDAFAANVRTLPETFHVTFVECCRERLPQRSPNQEHEQKHLQDSGALPGAGAALGSAEAVPQSSAKNGSDGGGATNDALLQVAREALKITNPSNPMDHLIDTFHACKPSEFSRVSRSAVVLALSTALAERRQRSA